MGARLVGAALNPYWSTLPDAAWRCFVAMSHTAMDTPTKQGPAAVYWAGHEYLMIVLAGDVPPYGTAPYRTLETRVKRAVRALRDAGAIELVEAAHRGRQAVYRLTPTSFLEPTLPVDNPVDDVRPSPRKGGR